MGISGLVAMLLGVLIICSRVTLVLIPAPTLRWFGEAIRTKSRTRVFGAVVVLIAVPMIWSGISESTGLAFALFIFGIFFLAVAIPTMVLFPNVYMDLANSFIPKDLSGSLLGWRTLGLVGVIIGFAIFMVGMDAM